MSHNIEQDIDNKYRPSKANLDFKRLISIQQQARNYTPYPKERIILSYTLLGGMLGGLILWIGFSILEPSLVSEVGIFFLAIIGGGIIGLIPALIASLMIVYLKIYRNVIADDIKIFVIGALAPAFIAFIIAMIAGYKSYAFDILNALSEAVVFSLIMGSIGGLSSLIIGYFVIPDD